MRFLVAERSVAIRGMGDTPDRGGRDRKDGGSLPVHAAASKQDLDSITEEEREPRGAHHPAVGP